MKLLLLSYLQLIEVSLILEELTIKGKSINYYLSNIINLTILITIVNSPHGIPVDLLDRTLIIATQPYSETELE